MSSVNTTSKRNNMSAMRIQHRPSSHGPDFRRIIRLLYIKRYWMVSAVLASIALAIFLRIFEKRSFASETVLAMTTHEKISPLNSMAGLAGNDNFLPKLYSLIEEFQNTSTCMSIIKNIVYSNPSLVRDVVPKQLCESVQMDPDTEKFHLKVTTRTENPNLSMILAEQAAKKIIELDQKRLNRKMVEVKRFLSAQENDLGHQLRMLEKERTQFQAETGVVSVTHAEKSVYDSLERSQEGYLNYQTKLRANDALIKQTKKTMSEIKKLLTQKGGDVNSMYLNQIQYRLNMLRYRKSMMHESESSLEGKKITQEVNDILQIYKSALDGAGSQNSWVISDPLEYYKTLQSSLKSLEKDQLEIKGQISAFDGSIKEHINEKRSLAASTQQLGDLNREINITSDLYLVLKKRLQEIQIDEASTVSDFVILRQPAAGIAENPPLYKRILFFAAISIFMCVALILIRDSFIPAIKSEDELHEFDISSLGYVPIIASNPFAKMPILLRDHPHSMEADAFRALRLKISSFKSDWVFKNKGAMSILITSPRPSSGKSFIAANTAYALAKSGAKTLLIDLDLRRPSIRNYFSSISNAKTLNNFTGTEPLSQYSVPIEPFFDIIIPLKPYENPAEKIESLNFEKLIADASEEYDYIIFDMPPVLSVIDPLLVIEYVDSVLLIMEYQKSHKEDIINTVSQLRELNSTPILGLINMVHPHMISGDGGQYYKSLDISNINLERTDSERHAGLPPQ